MGVSQSDAGVCGTAPTTGTVGVASSGSGVTFGLYGKSDSSAGYGLYSDGNAHVEGNLTWKAVTSYVAVPVSAFVPVMWNDIGVVEYDNTGDYLQNQSPESEGYTAPVHLPHGAVVTELRVGYRDGSEHQATLNFTRRSMVDVTQSPQVLASVNSAGSSGSVIEDVGTDGTVDFATIDNANHVSYLYVYMPPGTEDLRMYGVVIEYQIVGPY